jgi:heterodisulfide reductase subunit C
MAFTIIQIIAFFAISGTVAFFAFKKFKEVYDNIMLGKPETINTTLSFRLKKMFLIAFGQKKMFKITFPAMLHLVIYTSFCITQIELLEILLDGATGQHRILYHYLFQGNILGEFYRFVVSFIEVLSLLTFFVTIIFVLRRTYFKIDRFKKVEMKGWPTKDGLIILAFELTLITFIFMMNGADRALQLQGHHHYIDTKGFLLSNGLGYYLMNLPQGLLILIERIGWWGHLAMVFTFILYLPYSKHLHILLAFPNTFFTRPEPKGQIHNMDSVMHEVKSMFDDTYQAPATDGEIKFGAKDVYDLSWKSLLDAYTCTECGRCTQACPANQTGKKLSPRKIMIDTRDRMEEISKNKKTHGPDFVDNKTLLNDYVTAEELKACTTCNACVEECPVNISPLNIIIELRRNMIMDESNSPQEWNTIFANMENNQAPWQFSPEDRLKWTEELN